MDTIKAITRTAGTLIITFREFGNMVQYSQIPELVYEAFVQSMDKNQFFDEHISTHYPHKSLTHDPVADAREVVHRLMVKADYTREGKREFHLACKALDEAVDNKMRSLK